MIVCRHEFNISHAHLAMTENTGKKLSAAAKRALAEAEQRRRMADETKKAREIGGREGPEPTRYGDWEKKGIASDF